MMKKMLFLMLFLMFLGIANVSSQVRIGGNGQPNGAAVLDLNATDTINNGTKTLALPRVSLTSTTDKLGYTTLLNGMLVYNTTATPGAGAYYWDTNKWVKISDGTEVDGVIGNEITDTIAGGGLTRSGSGNAASPYKVGIKSNGIQTTMIAAQAVTPEKISPLAGDSGKALMNFGSRVEWSNPLREFRSPDTVRTLLAKPGQLTVLLDTTITYMGGQFNRTVVIANGIRKTDLCQTDGLELAAPGNNEVMIQTEHAMIYTPRWIAVRLRCFRITY